MPAVVRVKRHIDEEPLSAFLLNSKKRRLEAAAEVAAAGDNKDSVSTVLKFAGTVNKQNDTKQIMHLTMKAAKEMVGKKASRRTSNQTERVRNEMLAALHEERFRVVNCMRTTLESELETDERHEDKKHITIVDFEKDKKDTASEIQKDAAVPLTTVSPSDSDTGYVYDLYLPENEQLVEHVDLMDDYLSLRAVNDLVFEDAYKNAADESDTDSEDSNREDYFANDYPDEESSYDDEDEESETRDMVDAMERFVMGDADDEEFYEDIHSSENSSDDEDHLRFADPYLETNSDSDEFGANVDNHEPDAVRFYECPMPLNEALQPDAEESFHSASENEDNEKNA